MAQYLKHDTDPAGAAALRPAGALSQMFALNLPSRSRKGRSSSSSKGWLRTLVLVIAMVCFLTPMVAAAVFGFSRPEVGFTIEPVQSLVSGSRLWEGMAGTAKVMVASTVLLIVLLVPTTVALNLFAPNLARIAESLSVLPLVFPALALVNGVSLFFRAAWPAYLNTIYSLAPLYVILAMPLCYRTLDAGVKALDLKTLTAASSSLGARPLTTFFTVIVPNMRGAILSAVLLSVALALNEFAVASLLLQYTFPVFLVDVGGSHPSGVAALSFITMMASWVLLASISALAPDKTPLRK